ncbi:uncharacterized protein LOC113166875 isoform X1 [Anabas testudineus]|uniref:uncharacterized protein LOC113166875 isoform X1 n=1 Tax=Anabas testudineus TaxID=64144 RepID=UPI000E465BEA|nr:uncharacterized protein LOC113166875 isoform X1 [Anabas testudineus]XP_026222847.1 uncharacterized protein LOC113166875 isoform X1 [Anabas testudineus]
MKVPHIFLCFFFYFTSTILNQNLTDQAAPIATATSASPQSSTSKSVGVTSSSSSTGTREEPETSVTSGMAEFAFLLLIITVIVLSAGAVIRNCKAYPAETVYDNVREVSRVYEVMEENKQSGRPAVEVSTIYACAKYTKPNGVDTTDEYSLVTAPASCAQSPTEDNSSEWTFSVQPPPSTAPPVVTHNDVCSVPAVDMDFTNRTDSCSPPLYSVIYHAARDATLDL